MAERAVLLDSAEVERHIRAVPDFVGKVIVHKDDRYYAGRGNDNGWIVLRRLSSCSVRGEEIELYPSIEPFDAQLAYALGETFPRVAGLLPMPTYDGHFEVEEQLVPTTHKFEEFRKPLIAAGAHTLPFRYTFGDKAEGNEFSWHFVTRCLAAPAPFMPLGSDVEWCTHDTYDHGVGLSTIPAISMAVLCDLSYRSQLLRHAGAIGAAIQLEESIWPVLDHCSGASFICEPNAVQTPVTALIKVLYNCNIGDASTILVATLRDFNILGEDEYLTNYHGRLDEVWPEEAQASERIMEVLRSPLAA